jgi:ATP-dependent Clp protease adaptor protein ClpS
MGGTSPPIRKNMANTSVKDKEIVDQKIKTPSKFHVIIYNDNYTTMECVIEILTGIFRHSQEDAIALTLKVHKEGSAIAGTYHYEIAEQKALDATSLARNQGFPLVLKIMAD